MEIRARAVLFPLLILSTCLVLALSGNEKPPVFRAGAAVVDVTPQKFPARVIGMFTERTTSKVACVMSASTRCTVPGASLLQRSITSMAARTNAGTKPASSCGRNIGADAWRCHFQCAPSLVRMPLPSIGLSKRICVNCKEPYHPTAQEYDRLAMGYGKNAWEALGMGYREDFQLYRGRGCETCTQTGLKGRVALHELLSGSDELRNLIQHRAKTTEMQSLAAKEGMITLLQDGILKMKAGNASGARSNAEELLKENPEDSKAARLLIKPKPASTALVDASLQLQRELQGGKPDHKEDS